LTTFIYFVRGED